MSLTCNICDELSGDELSVRRIERRRIERDELSGDELSDDELIGHHSFKAFQNLILPGFEH